MSPPLIAQVQGSIAILNGKDGTTIGQEKIQRLLRNTRYVRQRCKQLGFLVYGQSDSPIVPLMTFFITKVAGVAREALKRRIGLIGVGPPATPMNMARIRLCLSADHTKDELDEVLHALDEIGNAIGIKYGKDPFPKDFIVKY